ncbi:thermonuclease family protein [Novosphingobium taihuense]|uniref:Endonuclease YncB(Thermonuclease family) n=1 Tax=Novosphingobium taihuense TaxID=260085 RepID=A0A7W7A8K2_9SPHN|nr:thermonuclease family protein [Novosphingobium taihuense]MBB4611879.1 endonuclease YncB(thermonuclease family) [Novosphingobium taihuense]TWH88766.1 endonuclease YncB(thermonuclease family) [Novosphingobium taihuense]
MRMLISLALVAMPLPAAAQIVSGQATALDGDTLEMTGQPLRLTGIDAPELAQTCQRDGAAWDCGVQAKRHLALLLQGGEAECTVLGQHAQGLAIAGCTVDGRDLSEAMIAAGLAVASEPHSGDVTYSDIEDRVKAGKVGLWAGGFDRPADWRKAHPKARLVVETGGSERASGRPAASGGRQLYHNSLGCAIKGNVSRRNGEYIYYLPGMKYYDGTRPERLFCTEAEAEAAGFRRSRGG